MKRQQKGIRNSKILDIIIFFSRIDHKTIFSKFSRMKNTPYGGSWVNWDDELKLKCHKKKTGKTFKDIYGRMKWDDLAPTITTQFHGFGNGRFGHPEQNRAITYREAALLQTFPNYYKIIDPNIPFSGQKIAEHIGNAVPAELGKVIARSIKKYIGA